MGGVPIFVVGEAHAMILQRQPCLQTQIAIFWACKRGRGREKDIRFRGIQRELRGARDVKNGVKGSQNRHPLSGKMSVVL